MKKLSVLAVAFLLAACGSSGNDAPEKTGTAESAKSDKGDYVTVEITKKGDDVTSISIDETYIEKGDKTKKELKEDYGMKAVTANDSSKIGKEWYEQIEHLEKFIADKGIDAVELDDAGYPTTDDVKSGCTINIKTIMDTVKAADANVK